MLTRPSVKLLSEYGQLLPFTLEKYNCELKFKISFLVNVSIKKVSVTLLGNHNHFLDHHSYFLERKSRKFYEKGGVLYLSHTEGSDAAKFCSVNFRPMFERLPASPVAIQNLHFECSGSLSNLVTNAAHADDSQSGPRHFLTHPICRKFLCIRCTSQHMT